MKKSKIWGLALTAALGVGMIGMATPAAAVAVSTLTVKVLSPSGSPLEGFSVWAQGSAPSYGYGSGTTNAAGVATLTDLAYGTYSVQANGSVGYLYKNLTGSATIDSAASALDLKISGNEVSGVVTLKGAPLQNTHVSLTSRNGKISSASTSTVTDAKGRYMFLGVSAGTYKVRADNPYNKVGGLTTYFGGTVREPEAATFAVAANSSKSGVNIALTQAAVVSGKAVSKSGKALAGVTVTARNIDRAGMGYAMTDANGKFTLGGLATGKVELAGIDASSAGLKKISVTQGKTVNAGSLVFKNGSPATGKIKGTLVNKGGKNVAASVSFISAKKRDFPFVAWTDKGKSTYELAGVPVGKYKVVVSGTNKSSGTITVKKGKTTKVKKLSRVKGTTISGTVKTSSGKAVKQNYVTIVDGLGTFLGSAQLNSKGKYKVYGATAGTYTVYSTQTSTDLPKVTVTTVKKGKAKKVNFRLKKGVAVKGIVRSSAGKAVVGVNVNADGYESGYYGTSVVTSTSGKFTVRPLAKGKLSITASDPYPGGYVNKTIKVKAPASKAKIVFSKR